MARAATPDMELRPIDVVKTAEAELARMLADEQQLETEHHEAWAVGGYTNQYTDAPIPHASMAYSIDAGRDGGRDLAL